MSSRPFATGGLEEPDPAGKVPDQKAEEPREGGGFGQSSLGVFSVRSFFVYSPCLTTSRAELYQSDGVATLSSTEQAPEWRVLDRERPYIELFVAGDAQRGVVRFP